MTVSVGDVGKLRSDSHSFPGTGRDCIHILNQPPDRLVLDSDIVAALNFQLRLCPPPSPCIASRVGDIVTIAFDAEGPATGGSPHYLRPPRFRFRHRLHPMRWANATSPDQHHILGVLL